ncbi:DUF4214 domain-containing protein [Salinarimonas ramus]|uniref:DUF4214 domain-containing protein n=1 Tax=Salinarimonas ramus TaxID=690164 RepID=A0A917V224_9HYPH|nr:DUF4214 domain-containing protein [Salinarimonas ramus]GGK18259.1 hypothetical protein GCM10011322_01240 [Salinarimonas ramus]
MAHLSQGTIPAARLGSLGASYDQLMASDAFYKVDLVALNNSGVIGGAFLALDFETNMLTVITAAAGVEAGQIHPQHIHGFPSATQDANVPSIAQDDDGDGFVELIEGFETYGPVLLNLTSPAGAGAEGFPAPTDGDFVFLQSYDLDALMFDQDPDDATPAVALSQILTGDNLVSREIVLHGQSLREGQGSGEGEADGTAGYKLVLPIAAGEIEALSGEEVAYQFGAGRFQAGDLVAALDVQGNAGQAFRLFDVFDRDPDRAGLSSWVEFLDEGGSLASMASAFLLSNEFATKFGAASALSNEEYVNILFANVLDREADAEGAAFWSGQLDAGLSREAALVAFTESAENQAQVAPQISAGILLDATTII